MWGESSGPPKQHCGVDQQSNGIPPPPPPLPPPQQPPPLSPDPAGRCCAGEKCKYPYLPLEGSGIRQCADCGRIVHDLCSIEDLGGGNPAGGGSYQSLCPECSMRRAALRAYDGRGTSYHPSYEHHHQHRHQHQHQHQQRQPHRHQHQHQHQQQQQALDRTTNGGGPDTKICVGGIESKREKEKTDPLLLDDAVDFDEVAGGDGVGNEDTAGGGPSKRGRKKAPRIITLIPDLDADVDVSEPHERWKGIATKPDPKRKKSVWWNAFAETSVDNEKKACCNLCGKALSSKGTSTMRRHLFYCKEGGRRVWKRLMMIAKENPNDAEKQHLHEQDIAVIEKAAKEGGGPEGRKKRAAAGSTPPQQPPHPPRPRGRPPKYPKTEHGATATTAAGSGNAASAGGKAEPNKPKYSKKTKFELTEEAKKRQALFAAMLNRPFSDFENRAFHEMLDATVAAGRASSLYKFSADTVRSKGSELADRARNELKRRLTGKKVVAAADHWSSRDRHNYSSLTVHWIEDYRLHAAVLSVYVSKGDTDDVAKERLVDYFLAKLEEWRIVAAAVPFLVMDPRANSLDGMDLSEPSSEHTLDRIFCLDQLFQQVANVALQAILDTDDMSYEPIDEEDEQDDDEEEGGPGAEHPKKELLKEARIMIKFFHRSPGAMEHLKNIQSERRPEKPPVEVIRDLSPRWWSTLAMLDRLFELRESIVAFYVDYGQRFPRPNKGPAPKMFADDEWKVLDNLRTVLRPLQVAQKLLEGEKYITSSLVPFIVHCVHSELQNVELAGSVVNSSVNEVAKRMLQKFRELFGHQIGDLFQDDDSATAAAEQEDYLNRRQRQVGLCKASLLAHALDPRFKTLAYMTDENRAGVWNVLLEEMVSLAPKQNDSTIHPTGPGEQDSGSGSDPLCTRQPQQHVEGGGSLVATSASPSSSSEHKRSGGWSSDPVLGRYAAMLTTAGAGQADGDAADAAGANWRESCRSELTVYQAEKPVPLGRVENILTWWKDNAERYPTLWKLAELYLAIPATAGPPHRAFHVDGCRKTLQRCHLAGLDTSEELHFLHENVWLLGGKNAKDGDD